MDQHALSLKLFKKQRNRKKHSFIRQKRRQAKEQKELDRKKHSFTGQKRRPAREQKELYRKKRFPFSKKGQVLLEALFFIVCILSFLSMIQLFQALARKEIQKERLTKQKEYKQRKAPWFLKPSIKPSIKTKVKEI